MRFSPVRKTENSPEIDSRERFPPAGTRKPDEPDFIEFQVGPACQAGLFGEDLTALPEHHPPLGSARQAGPT
jgi:hypothetical protein